jgi:hypothetical protein
MTADRLSFRPRAARRAAPAAVLGPAPRLAPARPQHAVTEGCGRQGASGQRRAAVVLTRQAGLAPTLTPARAVRQGSRPACARAGRENAPIAPAIAAVPSSGAPDWGRVRGGPA